MDRGGPSNGGWKYLGGIGWWEVFGGVLGFLGWRRI